MDNSELSWIAGTFESEGSTTIDKACGRKLGSLYCSVSSTDPEMLEPFVARWPVELSYKTPPGNRRPSWTWRVGSKRAAAFLNEILPYLRTTRVKRKASLALEYQATKARTGLSRRHVSQEYRDLQVRYYEEMKALNHRGL
jgi:hypothetical protein